MNTVTREHRLELSVGLISFSAEPTDDWSRLVRDARLYDEAGVDRIVVSDHVVFGESLDDYSRPELGGQRDGRQPTGPDGYWLEPLVTLSTLAGVTNRVRLGTGILLAALRRPVVLAKQLATLDALSAGRVDLGVGVGWQAAEYTAAGLDFDSRGRLLDHALEVCEVLWTQTRSSYRAPELEFDAIHMMPKPRQPGGVPIWVSGTVNARVARRVARFGCRWIPWGADARDLPRGVDRMRSALEKIGADPGRLEVVGYLPVKVSSDGGFDLDATMSRVGPLRAAGATDLRARLALPWSEDRARAELDAFVRAFRIEAGDDAGRTEGS